MTALFAPLLAASLTASVVAQPPYPLIEGRPKGPDIDVMWISREPRYPRYLVAYDEGSSNPHLTPEEAAKKHDPDPGEEVTFTAHLSNKGADAAGPFHYRWYMDGALAGEGACPGLAPGQRTEFALKWNWQTGRHSVAFCADTLDEVAENCESNNVVDDFTDAWSIAWWVKRDAAAALDRVQNDLGSYSVEDWLQTVHRFINTFFTNAKYPLTPNGIYGRIRIDHIEMIDDPSHGADENPSSKLVDGNWSHYPPEPEKYAQAFARFSQSVEWGLCHELMHQLSIIDLYHMNVPARLSSVIDVDGRPLKESRPDKAGHVSRHNDLMNGMCALILNEWNAYALNRSYGNRRGYYGDYLMDLPADNWVRILAKDGRPLAGAQVEVFQRDGEDVPNIVRHQGVTDQQGLFHFGPEPFGAVNCVGVNGTLMFRIRAGDKVDYQWLEIVDFNLAYWRGHTQSATFDLPTDIDWRQSGPSRRQMTGESAGFGRTPPEVRRLPPRPRQRYIVWWASDE